MADGRIGGKNGFAFPATVIILGIALLSLAAVPPIVRLVRDQLRGKLSDASRNLNRAPTDGRDFFENKDSAQRGAKPPNSATSGCKNDLKNHEGATLDDGGDKWIFKNKFFQFQFPKELYVIGSPVSANDRVSLGPCDREEWMFFSLRFMTRKLFPEYRSDGGRRTIAGFSEYDYFATGKAAEDLKTSQGIRVFKSERFKSGAYQGYRSEYQFSGSPPNPKILPVKRIRIHIVTGNSQEGELYTIESEIAEKSFDKKLPMVNAIIDSFKILGKVQAP